MYIYIFVIDDKCLDYICYGNVYEGSLDLTTQI